MYVVIAGGGKVGRDVASSLAAEGHEIMVLEKKASACALTADVEGIRHICDDACEPRILERAETRRADVVAALTGDDEDNLVVAFLAKTQFGVPRVIARINNPKNEWLFDRLWGVDVAVSSARLIAEMIHEEVGLEGLVTLLKLQKGDVSLVETEISAGSAGEGKRIVDLTLPEDCVIAAVIREDHVLFPKGDTELKAGDNVLVLVAADAGERLMAALK